MESRVVQVHCIARPSEALRSRLTYMPQGTPKTIGGMLDSLTKVDALAELLSRAITTLKTSDGRLDSRDVGAFIIHNMVTNGGAARPMLALPGVSERDASNIQAMAADMVAASALGLLITKGIEATQEPSGLVDTKKVAAFVFRSLGQLDW